MGHPIWPLYDLRLRTGNLELRLPTDAELVELIGVARAGIHPPDEMPFAVPWTDLPSPEFERSAYQFHVGTRAGWRPDRWALPLGVWADGRLAGIQDLSAEGFATRRAVHTGSWLGEAFQGRGIGTLMRQAVLALAFDHLGAEIAESEAFLSNPASAAVSRAVGYEPNGMGRVAPRGEPIDTERFRMTFDQWRARERPVVEVEGLDACLELFGAR
jgi:RimJ/RimL family protein N-acetyltransferase